MDLLENLVMAVEWVPTLLSFLLAYGLGWFWYSDAGWGKKWRDGKDGEVWQAPMWMPMAAQLGATLLLAIIINLAHSNGDLAYAVLITLTLMGFIKANGMYAGKNKMAISIEVLYILFMAIVILGVNMIF